MAEAFTHKPSVHRPARAPATAADVLRPAPATIEPRGHVAAAAYLMKHAGVTALAVVDDDQATRPVGIITEADIAQAVADGKDVNDLRIRALITTHPAVINPGTSIRDAARSMVTGHFPAPAGGRRSRPDRDGPTSLASPALTPPSPEPAGLRPDHTARPLRQRAEKEPNMNDVLDFVLGAHGGLKRWLSAQHLLSG